METPNGERDQADQDAEGFLAGLIDAINRLIFKGNKTKGTESKS